MNTSGEKNQLSTTGEQQLSMHSTTIRRDERYDYGTVVFLSFRLMAKSVYMRSKAWLAASARLQLARLPPPASRMRHSRRLSDTLAAAPGLLVQASVT